MLVFSVIVAVHILYCSVQLNSLILQTSLTMLMEKLTVANPHFIRCVKPNTEKVRCFLL